MLLFLTSLLSITNTIPNLDQNQDKDQNHNLESYKLDNVAAHFMRGKIKNIISIKKGGIEMGGYARASKST